MIGIALVLTCCAYVGCGQRLQTSPTSVDTSRLYSLSQSFAQVDEISDLSRARGTINPVKALALGLLAMDPTRALVSFRSESNPTMPRLGRRSAPMQRVTRREAVALGGLATSIAASPRRAWGVEINAKLNDDIVLILRVREATEQETRLITTGKYKELQRLDIKRAIRFMLDNYQLQSRLVAASSYAKDRQQQAMQYAGVAVDGLNQIIEYFPEALQADALTDQKKKFVLDGLSTTRKNIDFFMDLMPQDVVKAANEQIEEENRLNAEEYPKDEQMKNMDAEGKVGATSTADNPTQVAAS